jgi:hypothetical protein
VHTLNVTPKVTTAKPPIQAFLFCTKSLTNLDDDMIIFNQRFSWFTLMSDFHLEKIEEEMNAGILSTR